MTTDSRVDWSLAGTRPDPIYGAGALPVEKNLARAAGGSAVLLVVGHVVVAAPDVWAWWQYLVAAIVAYDMVGGVVANGLNSAKRDHFGRSVLETGLLSRLVRRPIAFAAVHVQPVLVGLLFPGSSWWWGFALYAVVLLTVVAVRRSPLYLQRPVALAACAGAALTSPLLTAPFGFWWLPVVMVLKLTLAHAVQEEPYRPVDEPLRA